MMQLVHCNGVGSADVLELIEGEIPTPKENEVLIQIFAAGVNRPDLLQREGLYPAPQGANLTLGLEVSGIIVGFGEKVEGWSIGQRVCALTNGGGYAQYVTVHADLCLEMPLTMSYVEAAALPEAMFTVWANVYDRACLQAGESILVHGGSGSVGSIAIQMARTSGARVYATAGSDEHCALCEELGAIRAINYRKHDFVEIIKQVTGRGADIILDIIGGEYIQRNIKAAALDGRIVNIAYQQSAIASVNFMSVMLKRLTLTGSTLRSRSLDYKLDVCAHLRAAKWLMVKEGRIKPIIHAIYPFEQVADAHRALEGGGVAGKIVLSME